jgi:hypothetical protein
MCPVLSPFFNPTVVDIIYEKHEKRLERIHIQKSNATTNNLKDIIYDGGNSHCILHMNNIVVIIIVIIIY